MLASWILKIEGKKSGNQVCEAEFQATPKFPAPSI